VARKVTTHGEVLACRENQIRFHNRFLFSLAGYGRGAKCTPPSLRFALQKLLTQEAASLPAMTRSGEKLATEEQ
jgi:hypothetical protein